MGGGKKRTENFIRCKICGKVCNSLGYARHRAMHNDKKKQQKLER
jgi:ribosomal protein L34E